MSLLLILVSIETPGQDQWKNVYTESAWAERDSWQNADALIKLLRIKDGSKVAYLGCHEGYLTTKLSPIVGIGGRVFAIDISQDKLDKLKLNLTKRGISNVTVVKAEENDPHFPDKDLDAVVILDTYHEMKSHDRILQLIWGSLKTGGRLVICEPIAESRRKLTRSEQEKSHELGMKFVLEDLERAGFSIQWKREEFADRRKEKGDVMWIIVATK